MTLPQDQSTHADRDKVRALYLAFIDGWNSRNASAMAAQIADDGILIGFDGSELNGSHEIKSTPSGYAD
ncbi:MAG: SgcJ/EcaC family oxidoreductase [Candidatus Angelobacter sp.]